MSSRQQARELIDQAEAAIKASNPQYAIELLRQSILYSPKDADAYILLGIALAQMGMPADAENALKKATHLAPDNVKARYNLAVHQYSQGQFQAALNSARRAAEIDVRHTNSRNLVEQIESELGLQPGETPERTPAGNVLPPEMREGYEEAAVETMPFVTKLGPAWTVIGWVIAVASFAGFVGMIFLVRPYIGANVNSEGLIAALSKQEGYKFTQIGYFLSILFGIIWVAMDAINRRGNLLWTLPQVVCGFFGFTWVTIPVYMFWGRNN